MFNTLAIRLQLALASLLAILTPRRTATARRGAELMEVAVYAAIVLTLAGIIRLFLPNAFNSLMQAISNALGDITP